MSLAKDFRNAIRNEAAIAREIVWPLFTTPLGLGDIGRLNDQRGFVLSKDASDLPDKVVAGAPSLATSLEINHNLKINGSIAVDGNAIAEGAKVEVSATLTFESTSSFYFFTPAYRQVQVKEGPEAFGNRIWDADPHRYKLFDHVVYRLFRAETGILISSSSAGVSLDLTATYTRIEGSVTGSFNISRQTGTVLRQDYSGDEANQGVFAADVLRWRPAGVVIVDPS